MKIIPPPSVEKSAFAAEGLSIRALGYLTEDDTALVLEVTKPTLRSWRARKRGPPWSHIGRKVVYSEDGLREFIAAQTVTLVSSGS